MQPRSCGCHDVSGVELHTSLCLLHTAVDVSPPSPFPRLWQHWVNTSRAVGNGPCCRSRLVGWMWTLSTVHSSGNMSEKESHKNLSATLPLVGVPSGWRRFSFCRCWLNIRRCLEGLIHSSQSVEFSGLIPAFKEPLDLRE